MERDKKRVRRAWEIVMKFMTGEYAGKVEVDEKRIRIVDGAGREIARGKCWRELEMICDDVIWMARRVDEALKRMEALMNGKDEISEDEMEEIISELEEIDGIGIEFPGMY